MRVGFIGLGRLGTAMATRLLEQKTNLTTWNRTVSKAEALGAPIAADPADLTARVDIIILNLFDSAAVRDVLVGFDGVLGPDAAGKVIIDTTTNHFEQVLEFHNLCAEHKALYLEAPILGSVVPALAGKVTIAASGAEQAYATAKPILDILGAHLFYLPAPGAATRMKLINNLALGSFMATIAEALVLGETAGLDRRTILDILSVGAGNSGVLNAKRQKLIDEDFSTHFSSAAIYKDLHYLQDMARSMKKPAFTATVIKELYALNAAHGVDDDDFSVIYKTLKEL